MADAGDSPGLIEAVKESSYAGGSACLARLRAFFFTPSLGRFAGGVPTSLPTSREAAD